VVIDRIAEVGTGGAAPPTERCDPAVGTRIRRGAIYARSLASVQAHTDTFAEIRHWHGCRRRSRPGEQSRSLIVTVRPRWRQTHPPLARCSVVPVRRSSAHGLRPNQSPSPQHGLDFHIERSSIPPHVVPAQPRRTCHQLTHRNHQLTFTPRTHTLLLTALALPGENPDHHHIAKRDGGRDFRRGARGKGGEQPVRPTNPYHCPYRYPCHLVEGVRRGPGGVSVWES